MPIRHREPPASPSRACSLSIPTHFRVGFALTSVLAVTLISAASGALLSADSDSTRGAAGEIAEPPGLRALLLGENPPNLPRVPKEVRNDAVLFYQARDYRRVWVPHGGVGPRARECLTLLGDARREGLDPSVYAADSLESRSWGASPMPGASLEHLERMEAHYALTFFLYARHLARGRCDGSILNMVWATSPRQVDIPLMLRRVIDEGRPLRDIVVAISPTRAEYRLLRESLARYREIAALGPWPEIPPGPTIEQGKSVDSVRVVRMEERLRREGYPAAVEGTGIYSDTLVTTVKVFQERNGLVPDGKAGKRTLRAMNRSIEYRIRQIELNMERWRWTAAPHAPERLQVNVPAFRLDLIRGGEVVNSMRVMVGRDEWETPVFSDTMRYIDVNPYWNVPRSIAAHTILNKVLADSTYLASRDFEIFTDWSRQAELVDPATIDWSSYSANDFPFRLRQRPGNANALGRMKFMFPNRYHVYLHDTPDVRSFRRDGRSLSHGCIRVERPYELADFLLAPDSTWTRDRLEAAVDSEKHRIVGLEHFIPVEIVYHTAEVLASGEIAFYEDIYDVDRSVAAFLDGRPLPPRRTRRSDGTGASTAAGGQSD